MNNKTNSLITIVLAVAVVILFILQFTGKNTKESLAKEDIVTEKEIPSVDNLVELGAQNLGNLKIAFVNSDTLTKHYQYNQQITSELMAKQASAENKLRKVGEKLQADFVKFQQEAPIMGQSELERKQMEFMQREQEIGAMEQDLANKLADKGYKANYEYVMTTDKYLQKIGKSLGYDYIIGYRMGDLIMYANSEFDITSQVIEMLNAEYNINLTAE